MANNPGMRPRNNNQAQADKPSADATQNANTGAENTGSTDDKEKVVVEAETPQPEPTAPEETVEAVAAEPVSEHSEEDNGVITQLESLFTQLEEAATQPGRLPEDFTESANVVQRLTRFVIKTPRQPILDRLLAFFQENKDGVAAERVYLRGVSTLSSTDQQQVTYLHTLFTDLAASRMTRVNSGQVTSVLKKPEIAVYYNRKLSALQQAA